MIRFHGILLIVGSSLACVIAQAFGNLKVTQSSSEWIEIQSFQGGPSAAQVLALSEQLRAELFRVWGGAGQPSQLETCTELPPARARTMRPLTVGAMVVGVNVKDI